MNDPATQQLAKNLATLQKWGGVDCNRILIYLPLANDKLGPNNTKIWDQACRMALDSLGLPVKPTSDERAL